MKKYSWKFWTIFWASSIVLLMSFYFLLVPSDRSLQKNGGELSIGEKYDVVFGAARYFLGGKKEKTFLILFQNNMEIRPGGGFIGSFGVLKTSRGLVRDLQVYDTGSFDGRIPNTIEAPYPIPDTLHLKYLKMRDSNFSPDFPTDASAAENFYVLGQGKEKFDGVVAITTNVLTSFLKVTGPVQLDGYPGTYGDENAVLALEYQVEQAFDEQGIPREQRKSVMNILAKEIMGKVKNLSWSDKLKLMDVILGDLKRKDIQLSFKDDKMQKIIEDSGWDGRMDGDWNRDYLMAVDANLGAWKSDYSVKREMDYTIDLSGEVPVAKLKIIYNHTASQKNFMTKDYLSYLRVYVPNGATLLNGRDFSGLQFGKEILASGKNRDYFGVIVKFPISSTKTVEFDYSLPKNIAENYGLKVQKQAGINDVPVRIHFIGKNGQKKEYAGTLESDFVWE